MFMLFTYYPNLKYAMGFSVSNILLYIRLKIAFQ